MRWLVLLPLALLALIFKAMKAVGRLLLAIGTFLVLAILAALTSRRGIFVAAALLIVLALGAILLKNTTQPGGPTPPRGGVDARVVRVIDGDTVEVDVAGQSYRVRYIGMDTPETTNGHHDPYGEEATAYNRQLVDGKTVYLVKDVSETDRYGRLLRYVWADGVFVNAELVRQGYAQILTIPPDVAHAEYFLSLQIEAREAGRGLWGLSR